MSIMMISDLMRPEMWHCSLLQITHATLNDSLELMVFCLNCSLFNDLRIYALVQFVPCFAIPAMAILLPPKYSHSHYWLWAAGSHQIPVSVV